MQSSLFYYIPLSHFNITKIYIMFLYHTPNITYLANYIIIIAISNQYLIFILQIKFYYWLKTISYAFYIKLIISPIIFAQ